MLTKLLFNWIISILGVRFYVTKPKPRDKKISCLKVELDRGEPLMFCFYLCPVEHSHYNFGRITTTNGYRLGIIPQFTDEHSNLLRFGKDTMITFYAPWYRLFPIHIVFEGLLSVYLKSLANYIKTSQVANGGINNPSVEQ